MITTAQCKAARALLNWTLEDLARESGLSRTSLSNFEQGGNIKAGSYKTIINAFEKSGIEFTPEPGVRMRAQKLDVRHWQGPNAFELFLDDVYQTRLADRSEILCSGVEEKKYEESAGGPNLIRRQIERNREKGLKERVILTEGDNHFTFPTDITTYRWIDPKFSYLVPSIVYGNKNAVIIHGPPASIIVTENELVAETYRRQFELLWSIAKPVPFTEEEINRICENNMPL